MNGRFVDMTNDIAFRKVFGDERYPEILLSLLNEVLELPKGKRIVSITYKNTHQLPIIKGLKESVLDIKVTDERKISYIIEMQVEHPEGFEKRVLFNAAKDYVNQIERGDDYPLLNQVIFIGILSFDFFGNKEYIGRHLILNKKTLQNEIKGLEFNFLELKKFNDGEEYCDTLLKQWVFFIKNSYLLAGIPKNITDPGLLKAYELANKFNWTLLEQEVYYEQGMRTQDKIGSAQRVLNKLLEAKKELQEKHKTIKEKDKIIKEKDKTIDEKDKTIDEKDKAIDEKDKTIDEKDKTIDEKDKIIEDLKQKLQKK